MKTLLRPPAVLLAGWLFLQAALLDAYRNEYEGSQEGFNVKKRFKIEYYNDTELSGN